MRAASERGQQTGRTYVYADAKSTCTWVTGVKDNKPGLIGMYDVSLLQCLGIHHVVIKQDYITRTGWDS